MNNPPTRYQLHRWLKHVDQAPVECDGAAHLIARELRLLDVNFTVWQGCCDFGAKYVLPHFWVEVGEWRVDYRLRMWLGSSTYIPHGVFLPSRYPHIQYDGFQCELPQLPEVLYRVMATNLHLPASFTELIN